MPSNPYTREVLARLDPEEGSVPYGTDPMRIWGPHKNSWIRIQEFGSTCIRIKFVMIRGSGPRPDPESVAFCISMSFFMDPDPRVRIRVRASPNSFNKIFTWYFWKKLGSAPTFWWIRSDFYSLALKKMRYAVWGLRRGSGTEVRIRASALAPVR